MCDTLARPAAPSTDSIALSVNTRLATLVATILMAATACDKAKEFVRAGQAAAPPQIPAGELLDLSAKPDILFQVFGEASDPRMVPIAAITGGALHEIKLTPDGWQQFDAQYLRHGKQYSLYHDGQPNGQVEVRQGMWEHPGQPLYALPGCHTLVPLSAVTMRNGHVQHDFTVEFLASSASLGHARSGPSMLDAQVARIAKQVSTAVAGEAGISRQTLDSLDFHAEAFYTGATAWPTVVASFVDPSAVNATSGSARTAHLLVIADRDSSGAYHATFSHRIDGPVAGAAFRRYYDHLDVNGDGTDEIILQGWQFGGDTFLSILGWSEGKWQEVYRTPSSWCLDERPAE